jgi:UDP-N-acetylglucosamine 4,6-dehydratase/5-epimerase
MFNNSNVLITGGTGSFGKKCAEVLLDRYEPNKIILFSRDEQKHVDIQRTLFPERRYPAVRYFVGDVRDLNRLKRAFAGVDYVIHAAAMKHVDIAEYNPQECIATNVMGAMNVIDAAIDCGVKKVLALSTDKAANPINLYGATKLCSDKLFVAGNALSNRTKTCFAVVRYGNVVGSRGSVVPLFIRQRKSGKLTLTDERMTRFWITLEQGVDFALKSMGLMEGGEIYVPKLPSMKMSDLARSVGPECEIENVGIRPGEKLHECMISSDDARRAWEFDDHYVVEPSFYFGDHIDKPGLSGGIPCQDGFSYTSDNNTEWLSAARLMEMVMPFENAEE